MDELWDTRKEANVKVWLDDECENKESNRATPEGWIGVKTADEVIALLVTGDVTAIDLDHDLGHKEAVGDGYEILQWLEQAVGERGFMPPAEISVHSANPAVYPKMLQAIESIRRLAEGHLANKEGQH